MGWREEREERERLRADTLAVIQQLVANAPVAEAPTPMTAPVVWRRAQPAPPYDMQDRLEAFRNRQRFIEIEREVYYHQAMQRVRAATEQWP